MWWKTQRGDEPVRSSSSSLLLSSLELSDTKVYELQIRALLGTASHLLLLQVVEGPSDSKEVGRREGMRGVGRLVCRGDVGNRRFVVPLHPRITSKLLWITMDQ